MIKNFKTSYKSSWSWWLFECGCKFSFTSVSLKIYENNISIKNDKRQHMFNMENRNYENVVIEHNYQQPYRISKFSTSFFKSRFSFYKHHTKHEMCTDL